LLTVRTAQIGPFGSNCHLVADPKSGEAILIDPGDASPEIAALREPGGFRVTRIVCTHGHIDHVSGGAAARERFGAPLWLHAGDVRWLDALPAQAERFGFEPVETPKVDHQPADGETFPFGGEEVRVIHTPGHSPGSICLYFPAAKLLFTGDTLFLASVGRTDLPGGDTQALVHSIREKLFPLGDDVRFFPGHGPPGLLGEERMNNPFVGENARR
jgi:glyoxylase-like metal-dependent hydrolase (beta-lactamase superfamily II)